jgi:hypothetical protein
LKAISSKYNLSYLNEFEEELYDGIYTFRNYINDNEKIASNTELDLRISNRGDNLKASYFKLYHLAEKQLLQEFKDTQRSPIFVFMYSFFEGKLKLLCETLKIKSKSEVLIVDSSNRIGDYFDCLRQTLLIERPHLEKYFSGIEGVYKLRNKLLSGLILTKDEIDIISKADNAIFLQEFLRNIEIFFSNLLAQINEHYKVHE